MRDPISKVHGIQKRGGCHRQRGLAFVGRRRGSKDIHS